MADPLPGALDINDTRRHLYALRDRLPIFTIYDHPADWPDWYVARLWLTLPGPATTPGNLVFMDRSLDRLQTTMEALGLVKLMRSEEDDPVILESWI